MEQQVSEIKNALKDLFQQIAQKGVLTNEMKTLLAQAMEHAASRIQEIRKQESETPIETPIPDSAQLLWILSGQKEDAFVNYLRTYPDPQANALLRNPTQLQQVIQALQQKMPQGPETSADGIPHADMNSSNIYGFKYDPKSGRLLVRFQSGSVYGYQGVPPGVFQVFKNGAVPAKTNGQNKYGKWWTGKNPSLGASFHQMIKMGNYPYQKLS